MSEAQSKMPPDSEDFWNMLSTIPLFVQAQNTLIHIERRERPEELEYVALLLAQWLTNKGSELLGHKAWLCSVSYNHTEDICWPVEDEDTDTGLDTEVPCWVDYDNRCIVAKPWVI